MKNFDLRSLLSLIAAPILLIVLGLLLLLRPDAASGLIGSVIAWAVVLVGIGFGVSALMSSARRPRKAVCGLVCLAVGGWLVGHPLFITAFFLRFVGIFLVIQAILELRTHQDGWRTWDIILAVMGAVLFLMPMTASRLASSVCGIVALLVGAVMLLDRLRRRRLDSGNDDPNIIDAL